MIQAIAFDLGGVVFAEGKAILGDLLTNQYGYDKSQILKILGSPLSHELRKGLISDDEFWTWAKKQLPPHYDIALIRRLWYDSYVLDQDITLLIQQLKGKYTLVAFSGNIKSRIEYLDQKYNFRRYFDIEIYSYDYHVTKPDLKFVDVLIEKTGVPPENILYIDDVPSDAAPAQARGMPLLIYKRGEINLLISALKKYGIST